MTDEALAELMASGEGNREIQLVQTRFRQRLVETWNVQSGWRILEVGCGQGDTTAVLADAVGPTGRITAVDLAPPTYGAPATLGESAARLKASPLGDRIDFHFEFDVRSHDFPEDAFDAVVLAHCSWYFASVEALCETLAHVRLWSPHLLFSEWDLEPRSLAQLPHLLAVLAQGTMEAFRPASEANVRSPLAKAVALRTLEEAGWTPGTPLIVDSSGLQDGRWEIAACKASYRNAPEMPPRLKSQVETVIELLQSLGDQESLPSYSLIATR